MPEGDEASVHVDASQNDSTTDDAKQSPPWERRGEEFSAEKAWTLIQNLTQERDALKGDKAQMQRGQSALMAKLVQDGRRTPGAAQRNDKPLKWTITVK